MPRIRLCYDVPGWAYHQRALALQKYAPPGWDVTIGWNYGAAFKEQPHDLVLQLVYPCAKQIRQHIDRAQDRLAGGVQRVSHRDLHLFGGRQHLLQGGRVLTQGRAVNGRGAGRQHDARHNDADAPCAASADN